MELQLAWSMKIPTIFLNMGGAVILMDKGSFLYYVIIEGGGGGWPNDYASYFFLWGK